MPGRQSHGRSLSSKPKSTVKPKRRVLDAFAVASHQNPEKLRVKQSRLGAKEGGDGLRKRRRVLDDEGGDEDGESSSKKARKGPEKGRFDELDVDEGSDSEGNEWKLGQVDTDDDSDLDSDEAFGESDEERFEGFAFSGSTERGPKKNKNKARSREVDLNEEDEDSSDSELEEGDLGEGAVDLADMLDASSNDENDSNGHADEEDSDASELTDDESSMSSADDENDSADPVKLAALQNLIANLPQVDETNHGPAKQRSDGASEYNNPSDFGLSSRTKLTLEDLGLPSVNDPHIQKSLKMLEAEAKGKKVAARLEVPLARRQQDRLDRSAAYEKSKETLDRWTDTVKHNRRADHLMFPLQDNDILSAHANHQLQPTALSKPFNELEATIQSILEESGLATVNGRDDEDHIPEFEELESNKLSLEEVKARRDQLRMARDLLFREEAKAKRIKKIKSKSYRKVHRKQREKEDRLNREALIEGGFVPSEDEIEAQDRRRAEERMGARHRGSKWAKAVKSTGRAAWDEDARGGVTEMARRDEELRKRVEGKTIRREFDADSDEDISDSDDSGDQDAQQVQILQELDAVNGDDFVDGSLPGSKLANMKFMRKADAVRRQQNDAMVESIRKDLAGEDSESAVSEEGDIGRRIFGPGNLAKKDFKSQPNDDFGEPMGSDEEDTQQVDFEGFDNLPIKQTLKSPRPVPSKGSTGDHSQLSSITEAERKRRRRKRNSALEVEDLDITNVVTASQPLPPKPRASKSKATTVPQILNTGNQSDSDNEDSETEPAPTNSHLPFAIRDADLIKRAFAGADVVGEFEAEKKQTAQDEDEQVIDNTLPGWGSWVGNGVSKKDKRRNKGRFLETLPGVKERDRRDAKLEKVIINEKRVKKNGKYLASNLPHPFETRQQYERSLRLPLGPEFSTKESFQEATKPRILLKQGIIAPMARPLL